MNYPPLKISLLLASTWLLAFAFGAGCKTSEDADCSPACAEGSTCDPDTNTCVAPQLQPFTGPLPGRGVRLKVRDERAYLAILHPTEKRLLVGEASAGEEPILYTLREFSRRPPQKVALATSETLIAVAWLDANSLYQIALRRLDAPADQWQFFTSEANGELDTSDYRGSQHFDLSVHTQGLDQGATTEGSQRLRLVFHDARTRGLRVISAAFDVPQTARANPWTLHNIDDPAEQADLVNCSASQRERVGRGIGFEPNIIHRDASTYVAYQDGDCGDLRLARRLDGQWRVSVVDTGESTRENEHAMARGNTGRFASIGLDGRQKLAIAYHDVTRGELRVALERAGSFDIEVVDPGLQTDAASRQRKHPVGGFASLSFDADDIPWIAYLDATTTRLRLAHRSRNFGANGRWIHRTLDATAPTGFSTSLGYSPEFGMAVAAEHLAPSPDGLNSALHFLTEEAL